MKLALGLAAVLLVTACGSDGGSDVASDPATGSTGSTPTASPAAPGTVYSRGLATVMDTGTPELCLGPVAESYPPQCSGPEIVGWDWRDHHGMFESEQGIRWGQFLVGGTWDGTALTYESAVAAPVYDPMVTAPTTLPKPSVVLSDGDLDDIRQEVTDLPGAQTADVQHHQVLVDVTYDDGSLQRWADGEYGDAVVVVTSMLVDEEP